MADRDQVKKAIPETHQGAAGYGNESRPLMNGARQPYPGILIMTLSSTSVMSIFRYYHFPTKYATFNVETTAAACAGDLPPGLDGPTNEDKFMISTRSLLIAALVIPLLGACAGPPGRSGPPGATGAMGAPGYTGATGATGATGYVAEPAQVMRQDSYGRSYFDDAYGRHYVGG